MSATTRILFGAWEWNPLVLAWCAVAIAVAAVYDRRVRPAGGHRPPLQVRKSRRMRRGYFGAALATVLVALLSPINTLADGVLFSAHMVQHILLLLIAPGLVLLSLPREPLAGARGSGLPIHRAWPVLGWAAGVGSMWFWHVPAFCDAAATNGGVRALQTGSLLVMGAVFWWPILAPRERDRLMPGPGIAYLFTACLACTALGIVLTLTPIEVCPIFRAPLATSSWSWLRERVSAGADRQIGGLLMWIPMCLVYVGAIMFELSRWLHPASENEELSS